MILMVDNYDSFTYNIVQGLQASGAEVVVRTHDDPMLAALDLETIGGVVIGPGPGRPEEAGHLRLVLDQAIGAVPVLGVCLGMQALALYYGGRVVRAPEPLHGFVEQVHHDGQGLFVGLPSPTQATRYHSLCVELPEPLPGVRVTAQAPDGVMMGFRSVCGSVEALQFHPESIASIDGGSMLERFVRKVYNDD